MDGNESRKHQQMPRVLRVQPPAQLARNIQKRGGAGSFETNGGRTKLKPQAARPLPKITPSSSNFPTWPRDFKLKLC